MRFKLDENLPVDAADILNADGHDAHTVMHEGLAGKPDSMISKTCQEEQRVLTTLDTDFCNILAYPPKDYAGIIVIRSLDQSKASVLSFIQRIAGACRTEPIAGQLWIVQKDGIRIR
jgi:predicted nuclease of predicted toxin-antitoxin system